MKILLIVTIILLSGLSVFAKTQHASIEVDTFLLEGEISPKLFGSFWEYVHHWVNSPVGLSAQEIHNRGFDHSPFKKNVAHGWESVISSETSFTLKSGGYNPNGLYCQSIKNENNGNAGISQDVFISPNTSHKFYVYFRGDSSCGAISLSLINIESSQIVYTDTLGFPEIDWKKYELIIPSIESIKKASLMISFTGNGSIDLDEASLLPENSKFGIRKEYFDFYKQWSPGIIRYPGGYFADTKLADWKYGVGDIDKRKSPNFDGEISERFEIGTDEFIGFCKEIGAEPHLVVNLKNGTAQHASEWVEYCNGGDNTEFGRERINNGFSEPYDIKFWEIGNEQWDDPSKMSREFAEFAKEMRNVDESIYLFIDGNYYTGLPFFLSSMEKSYQNVDNYGWHFTNTIYENKIEDNKSIYLSIVGHTLEFERFIYDVEKWIAKYHPGRDIKQSVTEAWLFYNDWDWYANPRLFTMENAIWTASLYNMALRHANSCNILERTHNSGCFFTNIDEKTGERTITPAPAFYACVMQRNHSGERALSTNVFCPEYNIKKLPGSEAVKNVPWLDVTSTVSQDSLFISIVNRHPSDTFQIDLNLDQFEINSNGIQYILSADNILAGPSEIDPVGVRPNQKEFTFINQYYVQPLSLTILALPYIGGIPDDQEIKNQMKILPVPNPFLDYVDIVFSKPIISFSTLSLYGSTGQLILQDDLKHGALKTRLNLNNLSDGAYYVVIKSLHDCKTKLIIKCN